MGPECNVTDALIRRRKETQTQGRRPCEDGGRDLSERSTSQGSTGIVDNCQKPVERHGRDSPPEPPDGNNPASDSWPPEL